ncbi:phasin family protein [Janthinobacterium sp.]|uniref:phasin family protein n=1 Tax=Janthinobacterium sp. TaxID=1871054 RepID=UPI00293D4D05|nr:phasin family protein [Janthinobacterium sp.]
MFSQAIAPAIKTHLEAQLAFLTELSMKTFDAIQKLSQMQLRLAKELSEEMSNNGQQLLAAKSMSEFATLAAGQLHPTLEKIRDHQQRVSTLLANANADITRVAESHMPEASRTAAAVADELVRAASEETEKATQRQRAALDKLSETARLSIDGITQQHLSAQSPAPGQQAH